MANNQELPIVEQVNREISVYDPADSKWKRGRRLDFFIPQDLVEVKWTNTGVDTDVVPDHDSEIDVLYATRIAIQIDSTNPLNTSTDFDVNVETTLDGANWDTVPYAERNLGDAEIKTFLLEMGVSKLRLRGDNNAAATTGYVTARVQVCK